MQSNPRLPSLFAFVAGVVASAPLVAQGGAATTGQEPETAGALEEVIVTARKREESLQDVPLAVSAFTGEQLARAGAANLVDIAKFTPGIQFNDQGVQEPGRIYTSVRFRGLGSELKEPFAQVGSVFLDGVYMSSGVSSLGTDNIERVEIVKGPSSALFGRSTFAGAVNFITRAPSLTEYGGRVSAEVAEDSTYRWSASHEGPIVEDRFGYRLFVSGYGTDGQYRSRTDGGRLGEERTDSAMLTLLAKPVDALTLKLRGFYAEDDDGPPAGIFLGNDFSRRGTGSGGVSNCFEVRPELRTGVKRNNPTLPPGASFGNASGPLSEFFCGELPVIDFNRYLDSNTRLNPDIASVLSTRVPTPSGLPFLSDSGLKREQERIALSGSYALADGAGFFGGGSLSLLAGWDQEDVTFIRDFDLTGFDNWMSRDPQQVKTKFYELRFASAAERRFVWLLGASYFNAEFSSQFSGGEVGVGGDAGLTVPATGALAGFDLDTFVGRPADGMCPCLFLPLTAPPTTEGETKAVFGSLGFEFTERWRADLEWRYQRDEIVQRDPLRTSVLPEFRSFLTGRGTELGSKFTNFLPRFTVQYEPRASTNLWVTYSEGNNPGYFNDQLVSLSATDLALARAQVPNAPLFVDEEKLTNYEIGWKQALFQGRLSFSAVAYTMEWENQKTRTAVPITRADGSQNIQNVTVGGFSTDLEGVELEGQARLTDRLALTLTLNYAGAEFKDFDCGFTDDFAPAAADGSVPCDGNRPVQYPEWSGAFALDWSSRINDTWGYSTRLDGQYTGKRYVDEQNFAYIGDKTVFNLRAGVNRENLRIEAFVTNLFDDDQYLAGNRWTDFSADQGGLFPFEFGFHQGVALTPPERRQAGVRFSLDF
jgi:iron complex outermembrane receptor protein